MQQNSKLKAEFGDFQTPRALADRVCAHLYSTGVNPKSVLEPTCGKGSFLLAAAETFHPRQAVGFEINSNYSRHARKEAQRQSLSNVEVTTGDFFEIDWCQVIRDLPRPLLIIGNPPWVTNADLGAMRSVNLPDKSNFHRHKGMDARTGKANFDISEWMMIRLILLCHQQDATIAMLLKQSVARKVLSYAWKSGISIRNAQMHTIDAKEHFDASVSACLLTIEFDSKCHSTTCDMYDDLESTKQVRQFGLRDGYLTADVDAWEQWRHLKGDADWMWRSGVKHDCSGVMEFHNRDDELVNGLGETADLEPNFLYPMLKSSEVAAGKTAPTRQMLVTQTTVGEETNRIEIEAPRTWCYLLHHCERFDQRGSTIYKNRPRFSVFGVGPYTFTPWKVAVSGFYKQIRFVAVGPHNDRPVVFDDTIYLLPCENRRDAEFAADILNSEPAGEFFKAHVFSDDKRPIKTELLRTLDLKRLSDVLGRREEFDRGEWTVAHSNRTKDTPLLFAGTT